MATNEGRTPNDPREPHRGEDRTLHPAPSGTDPFGTRPGEVRGDDTLRGAGPRDPAVEPRRSDPALNRAGPATYPVFVRRAYDPLYWGAHPANRFRIPPVAWAIRPRDRASLGRCFGFLPDGRRIASTDVPVTGTIRGASASERLPIPLHFQPGHGPVGPYSPR